VYSLMALSLGLVSLSEARRLRAAMVRKDPKPVQV